MDCTANCRLKKHGLYLTSAFTSQDIEYLKHVIKHRCSNPIKNFDNFGRNIIHITASCGHTEVLKWLIDEWKTGNVLQMKDKESGWTALHRALYYGHIDCAVAIYKVVLDWKPLDLENHSPLDLIILDSPRTNTRKERKKRMAVVVVPFQAAEGGELTLQSGDMLEILNTFRTGWAVGKLLHNNNKGSFPINFVEEIQESVSEEVDRKSILQNDVYMWGNNVNFILGQADSRDRTYPELIEHLWKNKLSIKHVTVTKFHSVFLTDQGHVFTCGHGLGGRLGHPSEGTVLCPKIISTLENHVCVAVASASHHTIILDELGHVFTFGLNNFHQLGHIPATKQCLCPKQITNKSIKGKIIIGIAAAQFHSAIYTKHELYTFGLNAGQLGHRKGENLQMTPKLVSYLFQTESTICRVVASDGATLSLMENGDLYLLQDYACHKIAMKMVDIDVLCMTGGMLKCKQMELGFNKVEPLKIAALHNSGLVTVWKPSFTAFKKCFWLGQKLIHTKIIHMSLGRHLILTTNDGRVYFGYFHAKENTKHESEHFETTHLTNSKVVVLARNLSLTEVVEKFKQERMHDEEVHLEQIPLLYRCVNCFTDSKSRTFAAIQSDPRMGIKGRVCVRPSTLTKDLEELLSQASLDDQIHDAVIKVNSTLIPVHEFLLKCRLETELPSVKAAYTNDNAVYEYNNCSVENVYKWLKSIYRGEETANTPFNENKTAAFEIDDIVFAKTMSNLSTLDLQNPLGDFICENNMKTKKKKMKKKSAFEVYNNNNCKNVSSIVKKTKKNMFNVHTLHEWRKYIGLSDITIESEAGKFIHCHKCILVARLEYFNNMLNSKWMESSLRRGEPLKMEIPANVLNVLISYIYTDDIILNDTDDISFIGEVIVCADQLLAFRLKEMCELALTEKVCLKNAVEIFQFSCAYHVMQLKAFTSDFIALNLPYYLQARLLEDLSLEELKDLSKGYKEMVIGMSSRKISPLAYHVEVDKLEKQLQESISHDLQKLRTRRSRTSSKCSEGDQTTLIDGVTRSNQASNDMLTNGVIQSNQTSNDMLTNGVIQSNQTSDDVFHVTANTLNNGTIQKRDKKAQLNSTKSIPWNVPRVKPISADAEPQLEQKPKYAGSSPFKKKSQKERKKKLEETLLENHNNEETKKKEDEISSPWGNQLPSTSVKSFRELLSEKPLNEGKSSFHYMKKSSLHSPRKFHGGIKSKKKLSLGEVSEEKLEPRGAWQMNNQANTFIQSDGFTDIVDVQQKEKKQQIEQTKKPLTVIQLEERAIEELKLFYESKSMNGEIITVQRAKKSTTTTLPFWNRVMLNR